MAELKRGGRPRLDTASKMAGFRRRLPVDRAALHEKAADRLRDMIVRGELPPGESIGEAGVCLALGMSRTPLREALKLLAAEGLVQLRSNRSARVAPMRAAEIGELFEAVSGIERLAAELAAIRATPRELKRLRDLQERMERHHDAAELGEYFRINQQIHGLIVTTAKNSVLTATHDWLMARVARARFHALSSQGRWVESVAEHRAILAALEAHDPKQAGDALSRHVLRTGEVVRLTL